MIPVHSQVVHDPPATYGDCLRACIASVLEVPAQCVPHFLEGNNDDWFRQLQVWALDHGLYLAELSADVHVTGYSIAVLSNSHAVVQQGCRTIHNPSVVAEGKVEYRLVFLVLDGYMFETWQCATRI